jgi:hypothetical protein
MRYSIAAFAAALTLLGCAATGPTTQPLALIEVPEPPHLGVTIVGHPDATADVTRQLFYRSDMQKAESDLKALFAPRGFRAGALLGTAVANAAARPGRPVARIADPVAEREELLGNYAKLGTSAGRIVDVVPLAVGYWSTYPKAPFRPWVVLEYRVYDVAGRKSVAAGTIGVGPSPTSKPIEAVPQNDGFAFENFDAIRASPERALEGLKTTIDQVAAALGARL